MDRLVTMEAFVRVVEAGSFSAAARRWGRSKGVVSKYIAQLESHLGVQLLQRTSRALGLTDAGERYHERCVDLLGELDALEASVRDESVGARGTLRVTAPPGFASRHLDALTTSFVDAHPNVTIDLHLTHRMVDLVGEGIDVAVRLTEPTDSGLVARRIGSAPVVLVASPAYLSKHGTPTEPEDLTHHVCLVDTNFREQHRWRFRVGGRLRTVSVHGPIRVNSPIAVRDLALAGRGIALCPLLVVDDALETGRLVEALPGTSAYDWGIHAIYARRDFLPGRVRAYVNHLAAREYGAPVRTSKHRSRRPK